MNRSHESTPKTYTEDELAGLFATYFGDKLTLTQLDSLVATVAAAHADRRNRATEQQERAGPDFRAPAQTRESAGWPGSRAFRVISARMPDLVGPR